MHTTDTLRQELAAKRGEFVAFVEDIDGPLGSPPPISDNIGPNFE